MLSKLDNPAPPDPLDDEEDGGGDDDGDDDGDDEELSLERKDWKDS